LFAVVFFGLGGKDLLKQITRELSSSYNFGYFLANAPAAAKNHRQSAPTNYFENSQNSLNNWLDWLPGLGSNQRPSD
jgi:hypothetical protein